MIGRQAILRAVAVLVCATAIFMYLWTDRPPVYRAAPEVGETFRIEAGKPLPHCEKDSASPLCQVERSLAHKFPQPEPHEVPRISPLIDWLFGLEPKRVARARPPDRSSVVAPVIIDYYVEALDILDAVDIAALPPRWHPSSPPHGLKPGAVRIEILVAFEDAHGMRWPPTGWHSHEHEYLLREPDSELGLHTEQGYTSREINLRWASSDCIGEPDTPLCAVETLLACLVRRDDALCAQVTDTFRSDERSASSVMYMVLAIDAVADESLPSGHKYAVTLEESDIYRDSGYDGYGDQEFTRYHVVRSGDGWWVVERTVFAWKAPQNEN
jgi:hypothetical protein